MRSPKIWILILKAIVPPLTPESHTLSGLQYILPKLDKIILLALYIYIYFFFNSSKVIGSGEGCTRLVLKGR